MKYKEGLVDLLSKEIRLNHNAYIFKEKILKKK
jgi:hypothetical protein